MSSRTAIRICGGGDDEEVNKDIFSLPNLLVVVFLCRKSTAEKRERDNMRECMKIS